MSIRQIDGADYYEFEAGVLVPAIHIREKVRVRTPEDILPQLAEERVAKQERFVVFTLDGNNQVINKHLVTIGLANQSQIHPREVFRPAILDSACSIFVVHNHPSGNLEPSDSDLAATKRLAASGKTLGIPVLDHLIVGPTDGFMSLRSNYPNSFD